MVHTGTANQGHYFSYIRDPKLDAGDGDDESMATGFSPAPPPSPSAGSSSTSSPSTTSLSVDDNTSGGSSSSSTGGGGGGAAGAAVETRSPATTARDEGASPLLSTPGESNGEAAAVAVAVAGGAGEVRAVGLDGQGQAATSNKWCEFNDTMVKEWEVEGRRRGGDAGESGGGGGGRLGGLEMECFGGQQTMQVCMIVYKMCLVLGGLAFEAWYTSYVGCSCMEFERCWGWGWGRCFFFFSGGPCCGNWVIRGRVEGSLSGNNGVVVRLVGSDWGVVGCVRYCPVQSASRVS